MDYLHLTSQNLNSICMDCQNFGTTQCKKTECNIGFTLSMLEVIKAPARIDNGLSLIPKEDTKYYDTKEIAGNVASICKLCKECNERHSELCSISLARKSLEGIVLKELVVFPGNILSYIINVSKQNAEFANLIMEEYQRLK